MISALEAWRQVESMTALKPLTVEQRKKLKHRAKLRKEGAGVRCYVMTQQALQDLWWVVDNVEGMNGYSQTVQEALAAYARLCRGSLRGEALSGDSVAFLEATAASNGCTQAEVMDFALQYMRQQLAKGPLHVDPGLHNGVESGPG